MSHRTIYPKWMTIARAHHAEDIGHAITRFARTLENDR